MLNVVAEDGATRNDLSLLDGIVREGARRMLAAALEAGAGLTIIGMSLHTTTRAGTP